MSQCQAKSNEIGNRIWTGAFSTEIWKCYHVQFCKLAISKKSFSLRHNKSSSESPLSLSLWSLIQAVMRSLAFISDKLSSQPSSPPFWDPLILLSGQKLQMQEQLTNDCQAPPPEPRQSKPLPEHAWEQHSQRQRHKDSIFSVKIDFMCKTPVRKMESWHIWGVFDRQGWIFQEDWNCIWLHQKPHKCCLT